MFDGSGVSVMLIRHLDDPWVTLSLRGVAPGDDYDYIEVIHGLSDVGEYPTSYMYIIYIYGTQDIELSM